MDLQHEFAAFEFASLELAGGLLYQETASAMSGNGALATNMQAVGSLRLSATGSGATAPTIQGIKFGDSEIAFVGASTCAMPVGAYGSSKIYSSGSGNGSLYGGAYANHAIYAPSAALVSVEIQALSPASLDIASASAASIYLNAYGAPVLSAIGRVQTALTSVRVFDSVQRAAGFSESSLSFGAYGATKHAIYCQGATAYAGQCTIKSDMTALGSSTSNLKAARVFDGVYALQGISALTGRFCAYGDQRATINGSVTASYVPTHGLRYGRLAKSYDVAIHAIELRGTIKPYETRKSIKPSETRGIVHPAQPRHSPWSEA